MAKRTESAIKKVEGDPTFLSKYIQDDHSLDGMQEYRVLPVLKVVQSMSDREQKEKVGQGSCIIRPGDTILCSGQESFQVVPLYFWVDFAKWSDLKDTDSPNVMARSDSPVSDIAKLSRDPDKRLEVYPGDEAKPSSDRRHYRYVEHLRFVVMVYGEHDFSGQVATLTFERGEFFTGKNFISAIQMRKTRVGDDMVPVPLWAQVWQLSVGFRDRGARKWYGIDFAAADQNTILESEAPQFQAAFMEYKELQDKARLRVDDEDLPEGETAANEEF